MASKSENADIAVLQTQMTSVQTDITDIKNMVTGITSKVDALAIANTRLETMAVEITNLKQEITKLQSVNNLKNTLLWVGLVASAIINVLVIYQLFTKGVA